MRSNYNSVFDAYYTYNDLLLALEADEQSNNTNQEQATDVTKNTDTSTDKINSNDATDTKETKNRNIFSDISEKIKKLIDVIGNIISSFNRTITNRIKLMQDTDKTFFNMYYKRKSMVKPYDNIRVVTYTYVPQILDQGVIKLLNEILECMKVLQTMKGTTNQSGRISSIVSSNISEMITVLLEPYGRDTKLTSITEYIKYIIERYRGEKKEVVIRDSQISAIEAMAKSNSQLASQCNQYLQSVDAAFRSIKMIQNSISSSSSEEEMKLAASNVKKASVLSNAFSTLVKSYFELKLEQSLAARAVLKRFYQF